MARLIHSRTKALTVWEPDADDSGSGRCWIWIYIDGAERVLKNPQTAVAEALVFARQYARRLRRRKQTPECVALAAQLERDIRALSAV